MTDLPKMAHDRCVAQIAESLFGQPGMTLMEMAGRREEIEALAKDAARYRWIRKQAAGSASDFEIIIDAAFAANFNCPHNIDLNIDAAMKEQAE